MTQINVVRPVAIAILSVISLFLSESFLTPFVSFAPVAQAFQLPDEHEPDRVAIRAAARDYLQAIQSGDRQRVAAAWTAEGVFMDAAGHTTSGRELAQRMPVVPRDQPANPLITNRSPDARSNPQRPANESVIRFPAPDVAIEDGQSADTAIDPTQDAVGRYTAVWVRRDGQWRLDSVRESQRVKTVPQDFLRGLSWMLGQWSNEASDSAGLQVSITSRWSLDQNYLLREVELRLPDSTPLMVTQRIGWDARRRQLRAWTFDSWGGHSEAVLTFQGQQLLFTGLGTTADGDEVLSRNTYTLNSDGSVTWESQSATRDGRKFPNQKLRLVRRSTSAINPASESTPR